MADEQLVALEGGRLMLRRPSDFTDDQWLAFYAEMEKWAAQKAERLTGRRTDA